MELNQVQFTQLIEAINQPKTIVTLEHYNGLVEEIDRLKKKYETGEKQLLEIIAGYHVSKCINESTQSFNNIREFIEENGFEMKLDDKGLHLKKK